MQRKAKVDDKTQHTGAEHFEITFNATMRPLARS
jgi:hypothetical protein